MDEAVLILGARGSPRPAAEVLSTLRDFAGDHGVEIQALDPRGVLGTTHLASAVEHALRARRRGRLTSHTLAGEALLYAAGERQVSRALERLGLRGEVASAALIILGACPWEELLGRLGWTRDDGVLEARGKDPAGLGIQAAELSTLGGASAEDLALERVALLDLDK